MPTRHGEDNYHNNVSVNGAVAQGAGAVAVGAGGVQVGGSSSGINAGHPSTRHLSAGLEDAEWPLVVGKQYRFYVTLGAQREGALGGGPLPEPDWGDRTELELLIAVQGDGLRFQPPTRLITLRKAMDDLTEHFTVEPLKTGSRSAWIMIQLARELTLLQEYQVTLEVVEPGEDAQP